MNRFSERNILHVRIGRLVVERDALGDASPETLGAAVEAALTARLTNSADGPPAGLVWTIAEAIAPRVEAQSAGALQRQGDDHGAV